MQANIKTEKELDILREGGARLGAIVEKLCSMACAGMSTADIDMHARDLIASVAGESAFLGYRPQGVKKPFPASVCVSVNDEIVHGIPSPHRILQLQDIVTIDCGLRYRGLYTDHAVTIIVGDSAHPVDTALVTVCEQSLYVGIDACRPGATSLDIGRDIESFVGRRYGIVRELSGHGVGYAVHEDPFIPNFAMKGRGVPLRPGMVLAVEPMLTIGSAEVFFSDDEYTVTTRNGNNAAHFEHTIIVTNDEPEVITSAGRYIL